MAAHKIQLISTVYIPYNATEKFDVTVLSSFPEDATLGTKCGFAIFPKWETGLCSCNDKQVIIEKGKYKVGDILYIEDACSLQNGFKFIYKILE